MEKPSDVFLDFYWDETDRYYAAHKEEFQDEIFRASNAFITNLELRRIRALLAAMELHLRPKVS